MLTDPDSRRHYDAVLALQDLISRPGPIDRQRVQRVFTDAQAAVNGWRIPSELRLGVSRVCEASVVWLEQSQWETARQPSRAPGRRNSEPQRSDLRDEMRRITEELRELLLDQVLDLMQRRPDFVDRARTASSLKERRAWLSSCYNVYVALRHLQDDLQRAGGIRSDEDARLRLHVSRALVEVADFIRATQVSLGRGYSMKDPRWLRAQVETAQRALKSRGVTTGQPPWGPAERAARPDARDRARQRSNASSSTNRSRSAQAPDQTAEAGCATPPGPEDVSVPSSPGAGRGPIWWVVAVVVTPMAVFAAWMGRNSILEAVSGVATIALLVGVVVALVRSESTRRTTGTALLAVVKLTGLLLLLTFRVLAGMLGLLTRRRS